MATCRAGDVLRGADGVRGNICNSAPEGYQRGTHTNRTAYPLLGRTSACAGPEATALPVAAATATR
eukprot:scaffold118049_cov43-Phaeocystis_antarctica.AAC.1